MLKHRGTVAEATGSCICIVKDGILITPTLANGILVSITRDTVLQMARMLNIPVEDARCGNRSCLRAMKRFCVARRWKENRSKTILTRRIGLPSMHIWYRINKYGMKSFVHFS